MQSIDTLDYEQEIMSAGMKEDTSRIRLKLVTKQYIYIYIDLYQYELTVHMPRGYCC